MHTTPASLLERLRQPGEREAWDHFVELYTPLLFSWARRWGMSETDAADLIQEVFLLLLRKLPKFTYDRQGSFRRWLRTVVLNKRREIERRRHPQPAGDLARDLVAPDGQDEREEAEYRLHLTRHALARLRHEFPPSIWEVFEAHVIAGQAPAAVAAQRGISVASVYAAKSKVLQRLRVELAGLLD
jgi:RNA polymerase sigma-70 factor (ECF subfamily)